MTAPLSLGSSVDDDHYSGQGGSALRKQMALKGRGEGFSVVLLRLLRRDASAAGKTRSTYRLTDSPECQI
jgi:hypothetical protein